jgi:hypothetical protein
MSLFESESHSFVLRLWQEHGTPAADAPDGSSVLTGGELRGWVEHVQTGERFYFRDLAEIKRIIADFLDDSGFSEQAFEPLKPSREDE